ncbi:MAG: glycosyltransferase family 4 protein [Anaerolineales bacterium]|jgi:glycosyltransferase involved in cell wall biosynthesis
MHILLIHQAFAALDEAGGTRHHEFARSFVQQGHQVTVITGQTSYMTGRREPVSRWVTRELDDLGVEIIRCRSFAAWHKSFLQRLVNFVAFMILALLAALRVRDVDLVWGTTPPIFQAVSAATLAKIRRLPFLLEVRDLWPYFAVEVGVLKNPLLIRLSKWLERWLYRQADTVVVNSPGFSGHVAARGARQVEIVPNGVDVAMFQIAPNGHPLRELFSLGDEFIVLYAGAHGLSNDLETVLKAADLLRQERGICFVLLGDGKEKPALLAHASGMGLDNVCFAPPVPKAKMPLWLADADAGLAILRGIEAYKTTYPNKVFDYMAAGKPVILAIDGVIRQVVEAAHAGIFVQPGDPAALSHAVLRLAQGREDARSMGQAGRAYVRDNFNRTQLATEMMGVMQALARRQAGDS